MRTLKEVIAIECLVTLTVSQVYHINHQAFLDCKMRGETHVVRMCSVRCDICSSTRYPVD